jgi:hypothetical protein
MTSMFPSSEALDFAAIAPDGLGGSKLVASQDYVAGEQIVRIQPDVRSQTPNKYSIQVGADDHIDSAGVALLNHSCTPTTWLDVDKFRLVALRDITAGDDLTFFYPSTEWEMSDPFVCRCQAEDCIGTIRGAKFLPISVLARLGISDHILELIFRELQREAGQSI